MSASDNSTRVFWGTAWTANTLLERQRRLALIQQKKDGIQRVFFFTADDVRRFVPAYGVHVDRVIAEQGRNHPLTRSQYFCETIDAQSGMFTPARIALIFPSRSGSEPLSAAPAPRGAGASKQAPSPNTEYLGRAGEGLTSPPKYEEFGGSQRGVEPATIQSSAVARCAEASPSRPPKYEVHALSAAEGFGGTPEPEAEPTGIGRGVVEEKPESLLPSPDARRAHQAPVRHIDDIAKHPLGTSRRWATPDKGQNMSRAKPRYLGTSRGTRVAIGNFPRAQLFPRRRSLKALAPSPNTE